MTGRKLHGQNILVTGGSGSVGKAVCSGALAAGAKVILHGGREKNVAAAFAELGGNETGCLSKKISDLTHADEADRLVHEVREECGALDAVVNCVAHEVDGIVGPLAQTDPAQFTALLHGSVTQAQWLLQASAKVMQKSAAFVTIVSDSALFAAPNQSLIAASRAAVVAFCRNAALELARDGIRVNCVSTSFVSDSRIAMNLREAGSNRIARASERAGLGLPTCEDVANLCLFLVGSSSRRLTGQVISVNGGLNA